MSTRSRRSRFASVFASLGLGLLPVAARAAGDPVPLGPEQRVNTTINYEQEWGKVAMSADGERIAVAWNSEADRNIYVRFLNGDGSPRSAELLVNGTLSSGRQDEPMIAMNALGQVFVTWSDRDNIDGGGPGGMGCFGRLYGANDLPLGVEFQVNQTAAQSQWEPHPNARPGGGWAVTFNGDHDGNAYLTLFDAAGMPLGGDTMINTFTNNGQTEAEHAITADGRIFTIFSDFSGQGGGGGINLFGRLYSSSTGLPLQPNEFLINENTLGFDHLEPRMAAAGIDFGFGGFVIVWEDWGSDGSSSGIYARLYDRDSLALGPEFRVNQTTAGTQRLPEVAADHLGNFAVTWEDASQGDLRIVARLYDSLGSPRGDEFVVSEGFAGDYRRPSVAMDASGEHLAFAYGWDEAGDLGNKKVDVYLRLYDVPAIELGGTPTPGGQIELALELPGGAGLNYLIAASLSGLSGLPLPDGRHFDVDADLVFKYSVLHPNDGLPFAAFAGTVGPSGSLDAAVNLPANPILAGLPFRFAALSFDLGEVGLLKQLRHVTRAREVTIF